MWNAISRSSGKYGNVRHRWERTVGTTLPECHLRCTDCRQEELVGIPSRLTDLMIALGDVTGNGELDVVFGTSSGHVYVVDPKTGHDRSPFPFRSLL